MVAEVLPKSDFGEALRYIRNHWRVERVRRGWPDPDRQQLVEQLMKQVALGRKAWLFVSSVPSGERSAKMMSLVSSARRHDLDSRAYIEDVLRQLLDGCTDYEPAAGRLETVPPGGDSAVPAGGATRQSGPQAIQRRPPSQAETTTTQLKPAPGPFERRKRVRPLCLLFHWRQPRPMPRSRAAGGHSLGWRVYKSFPI